MLPKPLCYQSKAWSARTQLQKKKKKNLCVKKMDNKALVWKMALCKITWFVTDEVPSICASICCFVNPSQKGKKPQQIKKKDSQHALILDKDPRDPKIKLRMKKKKANSSNLCRPSQKLQRLRVKEQKWAVLKRLGDSPTHAVFRPRTELNCQDYHHNALFMKGNGNLCWWHLLPWASSCLPASSQ